MLSDTYMLSLRQRIKMHHTKNWVWENFHLFKLWMYLFQIMKISRESTYKNIYVKKCMRGTAKDVWSFHFFLFNKLKGICPCGFIYMTCCSSTAKNYFILCRKIIHSITIHRRFLLCIIIKHIMECSNIK